MFKLCPQKLKKHFTLTAFAFFSFAESQLENTHGPLVGTKGPWSGTPAQLEGPKLSQELSSPSDTALFCPRTVQQSIILI